MFHQILTPVAGNLLLSMVVAALPIATVLVALGILRRPAWQASLAGLIVGLVMPCCFGSSRQYVFKWMIP
jgi:lactate permease